MKTLAKHLMATALLGSAMISAPAMAEMKIAVVDAQSVFQALPQSAAIAETIQTEFKDEIGEVEQLQRDMQYYAETLQRNAATMSDDEQAEMQEKILNARAQYAEKAQPLQQKIQRRQQEERGKIVALIRQSIDKVAAEGNYDLILDAGAITFVKPEFDISAQVLENVNKVN
ncbi:OmpH family outer membrane protein [Alteromonas sp. ASW11-36]|uniref:OmpH family outer membrane protein n=1 Tax=Alteromonas arenosi TaxID=3055817 RepID=A0ABT7SVK2_9ALTE|nr:OmpH family outer membrane protein [Alteromonas sp. ASW11-36]MDM7860206.1 OmpH family outer membrane protein [Alteromonas sp. ASW11-36]